MRVDADVGSVTMTHPDQRHSAAGQQFQPAVNDLATHDPQAVGAEHISNPMLSLFKVRGVNQSVSVERDMGEQGLEHGAPQGAARCV